MFGWMWDLEDATGIPPVATVGAIVVLIFVAIFVLVRRYA